MSCFSVKVQKFHTMLQYHNC